MNILYFIKNMKTTQIVYFLLPIVVIECANVNNNSLINDQMKKQQPAPQLTALSSPQKEKKTEINKALVQTQHAIRTTTNNPSLTQSLQTQLNDQLKQFSNPVQPPIISSPQKEQKTEINKPLVQTQHSIQTTNNNPSLTQSLQTQLNDQLKQFSNPVQPPIISSSQKEQKTEINKPLVQTQHLIQTTNNNPSLIQSLQTQLKDQLKQFSNPVQAPIINQIRQDFPQQNSQTQNSQPLYQFSKIFPGENQQQLIHKLFQLQPNQIKVPNQHPDVAKELKHPFSTGWLAQPNSYFVNLYQAQQSRIAQDQKLSQQMKRLAQLGNEALIDLKPANNSFPTSQLNYTSVQIGNMNHNKQDQQMDQLKKLSESTVKVQQWSPMAAQ
jgi:hypothetical protein